MHDLSMEQIYQNYSNTVFRYLLSLTRDEHLAEEITQETFYQAVRSADRFDGSCQVPTWLCAIAKNKLREHWRKHPPAAELTEDAAAAESPEAEVLASEGRLAVLRAIHALEEPAREVVHLRLFGGLSFREIGEVFGRTENWARVTYYRAKTALQKGLKDR